MKLKALLVGALLTLAYSANAQPVASRTTYGVWQVQHAYAPSGQKICTLSSYGVDKAVHIKHIADASFIFATFVKLSWDIPKETEVDVAIKFGEASPWLMRSTGGGNKIDSPLIAPPRISYAEVMSLFLREMSQNTNMQIFFPGSERAWVFGLEGSAQAVQGFGNCITSWTLPTQPFNAGDKPISRPGSRT